MKKIFLILISLMLLVSLCVPIFAVSKVAYLTTLPEDIGSELNGTYWPPSFNILNKYYLVIDATQNGNWYLYAYSYLEGGGTHQYTIGQLTIDNDYITLINSSTAYDDDGIICFPNVKTENNVDIIYVPLFMLNTFISFNYTLPYKVYTTTLTDEIDIMNQYYNLGYTDGYNIGYNEGVENGGIALQNLPLVDKLTTFIATFTGDGTAQYITPLALCMILILIYILFIRWVLNLSKSAKLVKLTDIVVLIACICILLIFYIPMIDFTITQHQIVDSVETTIEETVRVVREPISVVTDETGEILIGPVGTVKVLYETTFEETIEDITESALKFIETTGG